MFRFVIALSLLLGCTALAQPAEMPPSCRFSIVPLKQQQPLADLSGSLPVPDYLDQVLDCSQGSPTGPHSAELRPTSDFFENDARRYAELLARKKYDWLILPAQTQFYGFDHAEREFIGVEVAAALGFTANYPDVMQVARALGEPRRRYDVQSVDRLARSLGVKRLVEVYAGHDGKRQMTLTVLLKDCSAQGCKLLRQHDWRGQVFSHEVPPHAVVNNLGAELRKEFGVRGEDPRVRAALAVRPQNPLFNVTPEQLVAPSFPDTPLVDGLLATLAPSNNELGRERLNMLALRSASFAGDTPDNRFVAAHAAKDLNRRPFALALLQGVDTPQGRVLRELLNGNLTEAQAQLETVKLPIAKLMLSLDVQALSVIYVRNVPFDEKLISDVFGTAAPRWTALVRRRVRDNDRWTRSNPEAVKLALDETFPVSGLGLRTVVQGASVVGIEGGAGDIDIANIRHLRAALARLNTAPCCGWNEKGSAAWPMYWLLETQADSNMFTELRRLYEVQGLPEDAMKLIDRLDPFYSGYPPFEQSRASTAAELQRRAPGDVAARYDAQYQKSEKIMAWWAQGQTGASNLAVHRSSEMMPFVDAYERDFPRRPYWPLPYWYRPGANDHAACTSMMYSMWHLDLIPQCLAETPDTHKAKIRENLRGRFHGNTEIAQLIADPVAPGTKPEDPIAQLRQAIHDDPENADNYAGLGNLVIQRNGDYAGGQKAFLSYPEFKNTAPRDPVGLSNYAYLWGSLLYWKGQPDLARPLYQIAADLNTGSDASLSSSERLALLDGDFEAAADLSYRRAIRYSSAYAYRDYLALLHVMGRGDEARAGFLQLAERFDNPQVWMSALVGQRMQGMTYEQFKAWVLSDEIRNAHYRGRRFAPYFALMWVTTDRRPPADFPAVMASIERDSVRTIDSSFSVARPHPDNEKMIELVKPSPFRAGKTAPLPPGTHVNSEYVLLAEAITATRAGKFPAAVEKFVALADNYPIEADFTRVAMAYFAYAAAKTGDKIGFEKYVEAIPWANDDFDTLLSRAFFAAVRRDVSKAEIALKGAFNVRPHTDLRPIMTEYQYAEACEIIARETGDARFTNMLVEWAREHQRIQPAFAWAYAVEAEYSKVPMEATRALAMTLYLDPASSRLTRFTAPQVAAARAWLKTNNLFLQPRNSAKEPARVTWSGQVRP